MNIREHAPTRCMMCKYQVCYDKLPVCRDCVSRLQKALAYRCPKCGHSATSCQCMGAVRSLFFYNCGDVKRILNMVKYSANKRLLDFLAELMIRANGINPAKYNAITFVPRSKRNLHRYGYDQAKEIARSISKQFGIPLVPTLKRLNGKPQKLLSYAQRLKNIRNLYQVHHFSNEPPKKLLLVDDIYTTGATTEACASILHHTLGCSTITKLVLAKTHLE